MNSNSIARRRFSGLLNTAARSAKQKEKAPQQWLQTQCHGNNMRIT